MKSAARFFSRAISAHRQAAAFLLDADAIVQTMGTAGGASAVDTVDEQQRVTRQLDHIVQSWPRAGSDTHSIAR